jgi:RES domain-containing protein
MITVQTEQSGTAWWFTEADGSRSSGRSARNSGGRWLVGSTRAVYANEQLSWAMGRNSFCSHRAHRRMRYSHIMDDLRPMHLRRQSGAALLLG